LDQSEAELETLGTAIKVFGPWPTALNAVKAFQIYCSKSLRDINNEQHIDLYIYIVYYKQETETNGVNINKIRRENIV
jgi:hypothetical protein